MTHSPTIVWYKQFWPWFLITIPALSMVLSFSMLSLAINTDDSLVVDEYYKEGKAINLQLDKIKKAKTMGIDTQLSIQENRIAINFVSGAPASGEALHLDFYHATLKTKDFHVLLTQDAAGIYRAQAEFEITGKWNVTLSPLDFSWRVSKPLVFPRSEPISFKP
jgi:hypothetical protein